MRDDVADLFTKLGTAPFAYLEIHVTERDRKAARRWPLLIATNRALGLEAAEREGLADADAPLVPGRRDPETPKPPEKRKSDMVSLLTQPVPIPDPATHPAAVKRPPSGVQQRPPSGIIKPSGNSKSEDK